MGGSACWSQSLRNNKMILCSSRQDIHPMERYRAVVYQRKLYSRLHQLWQKLACWLCSNLLHV